LVASAGFDAHVDVRDKLTPENFMAAYLIIKEAGGVLTDAFGKELPETGDLKKPFNIVASGNIGLHRQIIELLEM
ncbi:MAG: inositol monophosphatase, partial [Candidatus Diapherotrites archaeon]|nr:inositol monophosphatase [Candidatus Diapherotrites archaeon]